MEQLRPRHSDQPQILPQFSVSVHAARIVKPLFAEAFRRLDQAVMEQDVQPVQALLLERLSHDFLYQDIAQEFTIVS